MTAPDTAPTPARAFGRRILVWGPSGSGKTTVSRRIGAALDLPVVELDALFHKPDWQETPDDEFRAIIEERVREHANGWVFDGNYRVARPLLLPLADRVVWLRPPFLPTYWRLFWRTVTRGVRQEELWNGNRESLRMAFFSRDSMLRWGITNWRPHVAKVRESLATIPHTAEVLELRSNREVEALLAGLGGSGD